ncbi:2,3-bisphosphoglycerate-dependent phosphoglycerate mutase, partial [Haematococcus lacustris]
MVELVLIRHGESEWNKLGLFTGWTDVGLSPAGALQAQRAGNILRAHGVTFDLVYT